MLGLTPDPLSAGVGMRVAVAGPYGHERVTAWQDGADAQRKNTAGGSVSSGRARTPDGASPACRKRPFTTHANASPVQSSRLIHSPTSRVAPRRGAASSGVGAWPSRTLGNRSMATSGLDMSGVGRICAAIGVSFAHCPDATG